jgi:hypothetical protein
MHTYMYVTVIHRYTRDAKKMMMIMDAKYVLHQQKILRVRMHA